VRGYWLSSWKLSPVYRGILSLRICFTSRSSQTCKNSRRLKMKNSDEETQTEHIEFHFSISFSQHITPIHRRWGVLCLDLWGLVTLTIDLWHLTSKITRNMRNFYVSSGSCKFSLSSYLQARENWADGHGINYPTASLNDIILWSGFATAWLPVGVNRWFAVA